MRGAPLCATRPLPPQMTAITAGFDQLLNQAAARHVKPVEPDSERLSVLELGTRTESRSVEGGSSSPPA